MYTKTDWVNGGAPPINATNLNKIEVGIESVTSTVVTHLADVAHKAGKIYAYNNLGGAL